MLFIDNIRKNARLSISSDNKESISKNNSNKYFRSQFSSDQKENINFNMANSYYKFTISQSIAIEKDEITR